MWKTITDHPQYAVSDEGQVKNIKTEYQKIIRVKNEYCFVGLTVENRKKKWFSLHRLVALHFIPKINGKDFVNHKDGNKLNNHYSNLEWCTRLENVRHAMNTGLFTPTMLTNKVVNQYDLNGNFIREWQSCRFAERELNFANGVISKVALGQKNRKQTGGFIWKFKDQEAQPALQTA